MGKPDEAATPGEQEWPLLSLLRESGDDLEATSPAFDIAASAARLNGAASAQGLLSSGNLLDMAQTETSASLEEEASFDLEAGISRLKDVAHSRGLLSSSASEAFDAEAFLALVSRKEVLSHSSTQAQSGTREESPVALGRPVDAADDDFRHELWAIWEDPEVRSLALRRAKNPEVAEEALQSTYLTVSRMANPERIENLRTYFCAVLLREIYRELSKLRVEAPADFAAFDDVRQGRPGINSPAPRPFQEEVQTRLLGQRWLAAFRARPELAARVPRRSPDPDRYRRLIVRVAENMLRVILKEDPDINPDINEALRGGYAEWFAARDSGGNTRDQRLLRARADVSALLRTIVERGDLIS
jgi:hypothetical protein